MTAYSEVKILELSAMTFNSLDGAESTYQLLIFSWFGFYAGSRGLITTVETALFSLSFCKLAVRYLKTEVKILIFTICSKEFINAIQENSPKSSSVEYLVYAGISIFSRLSGTMIYLVLFLFNFHYSQNKPQVNIKWRSYSKYKICFFPAGRKSFSTGNFNFWPWADFRSLLVWLLYSHSSVFCKSQCFWWNSEFLRPRKRWSYFP